MFNWKNSCIAGMLLLPAVLMADDLVRTETRVDSAQSTFGVDGSGVIIAVLDRGIDYEHPDFRNPDGTTRILHIYDMLNPQGAGDPGNPYGIGTLYSEGQINAALTSGTRLATRDAVGHGIASAGLAGGNGSASGGLLAGMAPKASFIIVKITSEGAPAHGNEPAEAAFYDPAYIPIALDFVLTKAGEASLPVVLLANFGSIQGPMDGSSDIARGIDALFGPGKPGKIFITGSSDNGGRNNYAAGTLLQGQSIDLTIDKVAGFTRINLWYSENDRFDVQVITPGASYGPYISPANNNIRDTQQTGEFTYYHNGSAVDFFNAENNKREILLDIPGAAGVYTLRLTGSQINDGSFQASLGPATIFQGQENEFQTFVQPGHTIWDLASAFNNITPNSYVLRPTWVDIDGITRTFVGNENGTGTLWTGSGVGPSYDGRIGITVSVPGNTNFTTYGQRSYFNTFRFNRIATGGGLYGTLGAVSGAAPVLTGIVALMLDANPNLDVDQVRTILQNTARSDAFTGSTPNPEWGYGKVDAYAAVEEALNISGIADDHAAVSRSFRLLTNYPNPFNPGTTIRYELDVASSVHIVISDISGRIIRLLENLPRQQAGRYSLYWDGTDNRGEEVASGIYFYSMQTANSRLTRKAMLIR